MDKFRITFFWLNILHPVPKTSHYESKMVCEWQLTLNLTNQQEQDISLFIFSFLLELIELQNYYNIIY